MGKIIAFCATLLLCAALVSAQPYTVVNSGFELPGDGKIKGWDMDDGAYYVDGGAAAEVPGWESDGAVADSGVEEGWGATDGMWTAFLMGADLGDPSVYQLTGHTIAAGESFLLSVDARITWGSDSLLMSLYYDDGGTRVTAASDTKAITDDMVRYYLTFNADDVPASIGNNLGIEFANPTGGWLGMDRVRLVPEPMTMTLLGIGGLALVRRRKR